MSLKKLALAALGLALLILLCLGPGRRSTNVRPPTKPSVLPKAAVMATRSSGANSGPLARRSLAAVQTPGAHIELAYPPNTSVSDPQFVAFNQWAVEYLNATPAQKTALVDLGLELAHKRRNKMVDLIQSHPDQAIAWTFPRVQRFDLPQEVQAQLEQPVSAQGSLSVFGVLAAQGENLPPVYRTAELSGVSYQAFVYGRRLGEPTLQNVPLNGVALDNLLAVEEHPVRVLQKDEVELYKSQNPGDAVCSVSNQPTESQGDETIVESGGQIFPLCSATHADVLNDKVLAASGGGNFTITATSVSANSAYTEGTKKLIIIRVDFSDLAGGPFTPTAGTNLVTGLNSFYREMSFNKTGFAPPGQGSAVTAVLRMPKTAAWYGTNDAAILRADARSAATKANFNLNNFDFDLTCMGAVPGFKWSGLGYVGAPGAWIRDSSAVGVPGHELGHNFGLNHANFWDTSGQSIIGAGDNIEYGDSFDTMGNAGGGKNHFNARYKQFLNWLTSSQVATVSASGRFRLYPHDDPASTGLRGIRIVRSSQTNYFLEFRNRYSGNKWLANGLGIRWTGNDNRHSVLLDMTPGSPDGKNDSALLIGRTFSDLSIGLHITPVGKGGTTPESLDIVINKGSFPGNVPPNLLVLTDRTNANVNSSLTFVANAADPNADELAYFWDFGDGNFGTNSATNSHSWSAAGEYVVQCTASDMKGGTATDSALIRVGSPTTFHISGRITDGVKPLGGIQVTASPTKIGYTDSDGRYYITGLSAGSYTLKPVLYGYVFSRSGFSNPIKVGPSQNSANFVGIPSNSQTTTSIIAAGSIWGYLDNGSNQGTAWRALNFNDSTWNEGPAPLGYGDTFDKSSISYGSDANNKYVTTYFRKEFVVQNLQEILGLTLGVRRDDGAVVYLNNKEIFRSNMPAGTVNYTTLASTAIGGADETAFFETDISPTLLLTGTNIMAVEIHQANRTSSDIVFDLRLTAITGGALPAPTLAWEPSNGWVKLSWPDSPIQYHLLSAPDLLDTNGWKESSATIGLVNGQRTTSIPLSEGQGFFKLSTAPTP
jgi:hypothetical protein